MGRGKGRRTLLIGLLVLVFASTPYGTRTALFAIEEYQAHVSPHLRGVVTCRFTPTCSHYGHEAIAKYGLLRGGVMTIGRIARCGSWTPMGTVDKP
jgi:putative membrane protein insertion efficiency factor